MSLRPSRSRTLSQSHQPRRCARLTHGICDCPVHGCAWQRETTSLGPDSLDTSPGLSQWWKQSRLRLRPIFFPSHLGTGLFMKTKAFVSDPFINQGRHWPCRSSSHPHCAVPQADRLPHASQRGGGVTPRKLAEAGRGTRGPEPLPAASTRLRAAHCPRGGPGRGPAAVRALLERGGGQQGLEMLSASRGKGCSGGPAARTAET